MSLGAVGLLLRLVAVMYVREHVGNKMTDDSRLDSRQVAPSQVASWIVRAVVCFTGQPPVLEQIAPPRSFRYPRGPDPRGSLFMTCLTFPWVHDRLRGDLHVSGAMGSSQSDLD